jgi:hypothetical protein
VEADPRAVEPLATYVPADLDLYVSLRNLDRFAVSLRDGRLGEPLRSAGLGTVLEQILPALEESDAEAEVAFGIRMPAGGLPELFILARATGIDYDALVESNLDQLKSFGLECVTEEVDGIVVHDFSMAGLPLFSILTAGERVALASGDGGDAVLDLLRKDGASFSDTAAFKALHRAAAEGEAEAMTYVRADPVFDLLRAALAGEQLLGDPGVASTVVGWLLVLAESDLLEGAGAAVSLSVDEELGGEMTVQLKR